MKVAIAGGTGVVGAHTANRALERGHEVRILSRSRGTDLLEGDGLDLAGFDVVIDVSGPAKAGLSPVPFFERVTKNLVRAERAAGVSHHITLSIIGAANVNSGYYAGKAAQEETVMAEAEAAGVPWTILRTTQFFEFAEQVARPLGALTVVPKVRSQPLAAASVADRLVALAEAGERAGIVELAGPQRLYMAEVLRMIDAARGDRRRVVELSLPGRFGRALRDGSILPGAGAEIDPITAHEWIASNH